MNIAEIRERGKRLAVAVWRWKDEPSSTRVFSSIVVVVALLALTASFGLGMLVGKQEQGSVILVGTLPLATSSPAAAAFAAAATTLPVGGQVVASKNGSRYYLPWCGGARRISNVNKVWFSSAKKAEVAGYTPSRNCKGI